MYIHFLANQESESNTFVFKNEEETRFMMENEALLDREGVKSYQVLDSVGTIQDGFAVLNNIPVTEDGRDEFEARFEQRARLIEKEPGFQAIRVLRPLHSDTYIIMTIWKDEENFKDWQSSKAYEHAHKKRHTSEGIDQQRPTIFPRPSYVTTYSIL